MAQPPLLYQEGNSQPVTHSHLTAQEGGCAIALRELSADDTLSYEQPLVEPQFKHL